MASRNALAKRIQALTRENYRLMREELLKIVYWKDDDPIPKPPARDKVEAAKNVVMLDLAILNAEAAAGITRSQSRCLPEKSTNRLSSYHERMDPRRSKSFWVAGRGGKHGNVLSDRFNDLIPGWRAKVREGLLYFLALDFSGEDCPAFRQVFHRFG